MDDSGSFFILMMVWVVMMIILLSPNVPYETRGECLDNYTACVEVDEGWDAAEGAEPR